MKNEGKNNKILIHIDNIDNLPVFPYKTPNLRKKYEFLYTDDTIISDLFEFLIFNMYPGEYDILKKSKSLYKIKVGNEYWHVQKQYRIFDFIKNNGLDMINIYSLYGTGAGAYLKEINASIYINPNEGKHKYNPHVHVYSGAGKIGNCVRISLKNMAYMNGNKLDDLFSKKEAKIIYEILVKYQKELIDYYNKVQLGKLPEPIYIDLNNKQICFD